MRRVDYRRGRDRDRTPGDGDWSLTGVRGRAPSGGCRPGITHRGTKHIRRACVPARRAATDGLVRRIGYERGSVPRTKRIQSHAL